MNKRNQTVLLPNGADVGGGAYTRTVRDIHEWDGRTVGRVRHRGAEWVVQYAGARRDAWDALPSLSWQEVQQ